MLLDMPHACHPARCMTAGERRYLVSQDVHALYFKHATLMWSACLLVIFNSTSCRTRNACLFRSGLWPEGQLWS